MKILQITNRIPWPLNDGGNIATYNVTRNLFRAGHHITLASLNTVKHHQDPDVIKEASAVHAVDINTDITPMGLLGGLFSSMPYNVKRFWSADFTNLLQRLVKENSFDIIQLEGAYLSLYISALREVGNTPIVLRSHNVEHQIWGRLGNNESNPLKKWYLGNLWKKIKNFELRHLPDYDAIIPITEQDANWYRNHGFKGKLQVINAGVDLQQFKSPDPIKFTPKIAFLGSLEWKPNVQGLHWFLEKIWPAIQAEFPETELHVAGKNPPAELQSLKVPGMKFHGMVADAAKFLNTAHFFIVPLLSGGGMRLKIVEAMANGKCVISTNVGAEGIACTTEKDIFLVDTPEAWISKMKELLRNPQQSEIVAQRGFELANERYGWKAITDQFLSFYKEVAS